ncbi:hypothetical protein J6X90_03930 [Candidatus Saccharibacteria bacterium]|nr:hypothetical protein [Candidatus Saccharibacteria bacterium]
MKKSLDKINLILKIIIALSGVGFTVAHFIDPVAWPKTCSYLVTIVLPFIPDIFSKLGFKTTTRLQIAFSLFLVLSMVMGIDFDLYKNWYIFGNPCFDKIAHAVSGVMAAFVAKEILDQNYEGKEVKTSSNTRVKRYSSCFAWIFIVSFVALTAAGWECFEFLYDQITGGTMQELISTGLDDTMWDILGALLCGIISAFPLSKK